MLLLLAYDKRARFGEFQRACSSCCIHTADDDATEKSSCVLSTVVTQFAIFSAV